MKIDMRYRSKVLAIYDQIPGFLSQHEKELHSKSYRMVVTQTSTKKHFSGVGFYDIYRVFFCVMILMGYH